MNNKSKVKLIVVLILAYSLIGAWAVNHFKKEVPTFEGEFYRISHTSNDYSEYKKLGMPDIKVINKEDSKEVWIGEFKYIVEKTINSDSSYTVFYPDGKSYIVKDEGYDNMLLAYNMDGELSWANTVYIEAFPNEREPQPSDYYAGNIVKVAYEQYFESRGYVKGFIWSFILFHVAALVFFSYPVQMFLFHLSHRLDVVDPEPTEFYFISTKGSCIVVAITAVVMMIMCI